MSDTWIDDAREFDFFAFVRLCERLSHVDSVNSGTRRYAPLGMDAAPSRESVRFQVDPSLGFPAASISEAILRAGEDESGPDVEVAVTFFGTIGALGVMPENYGAIVLQRLRMQDRVLKSFLDLFHHRLISHFYRAWCKQHFVAHVERARLSGDRDVFTTALYSVAGYGTEGVRQRRDLPDETILQYIGHFSQKPRTSTALQQIVADYFQIPVKVHQFQGRWLQIERQDRTRLPNVSGRQGQSHELGVTAILGERLWDVQTMIRLTVGPLTTEQFESLLPASPMLRHMSQLVRAFLGPELDFEIQLVLPDHQVRPLQLTTAGVPQRLGWNCWLGTPQRPDLVDDAVFFMSDC